MAKDILINEVTYNGVESISVPTSGGGTAQFVDVNNVETWVLTMADGTTTEKDVYVG